MQAIDAERAEREAPLPDLQRQVAEAADKTRQLKQDLAALTGEGLPAVPFRQLSV